MDYITSELKAEACKVGFRFYFYSRPDHFSRLLYFLPYIYKAQIRPYLWSGASKHSLATKRSLVDRRNVHGLSLFYRYYTIAFVQKK